MMRRIAAALLCLIAGASAGQATDAADSDVESLRRTVVDACEHGLNDPDAMASPFGPPTDVADYGSTANALQRVVRYAGGAQAVTVQLTAFAGAIRRVRGELADVASSGVPRPRLLIDAGADCGIVHGRRLEYGAGGTPERLFHLGPDLAATETVEALNPLVPVGDDPGGVAVAHIDSGVNYEIPLIAGRLARDADGGILGFDFWDMDDRPFDLDTSRSPFFPIRHGTAVASILLTEAPGATLIPFRYPRPDMDRMADVVEAVASAGARIVMMPLGSASADEWTAFAAAARRHADILFVVSAGNDGRDIDAAPLYPASFDLDNIVVVTSADGFGQLAAGSNWGAQTVDLMVPGEKVPTTDHRGASVNASGSSFAVPRVAALTARMLAGHPAWRAPDLVAAIRARASPPLVRGASPVRWGWIPNPADDG